MSQYEVSTLKKGLQILDVLMLKGEMTLTDIMDYFQWNKTTTFRLLHTLENMGFIQKGIHGFNLTGKSSTPKQPHNPLVDWVSVPALYELSRKMGETMYIGILDGSDVVTTQIVDGTHAMRIHSTVGDRDPAHGSALGKAILAFMEPDLQQSFLRHLPYAKTTIHTFDDKQMFLYHLEAIKKRGYAIDDEETAIGVRCIAVPIYSNGRVIASAAISGPVSRLSKKMDKTISKELKACSKRITEQLENN
ncbi:IclR family KDG regulon transcriptional repressor [Bacillus ectoiniformans]|uniref:IclR family transcriptional regulator n=1 Tax=Bacillus ectoiniformans TaxID=1494429 RepID=UPI00195780ED|nr:IclR family transcriptional regulator [Bacillus ectoiniformans]MBM7649634.1 IclR family KDG regulon transcriptional repressor [Bacillus ectoiniformans]